MSGETILIEQLRAEVERLRERAEKAEREIDRLRSDAKTLAGEHFASDYRAAIARADKAEDERDAYKRAKEENDERFMRERDEARAHAAKARPVCTCSRRLGDYCPTPDPDCAVHSTKAVKP